ncbi:aldehyde dehydrogenase domain-containing protein [Dioszegia hungarica]|uniref:Aldehyde dehydrogenase domain-containing protein n=1 Tax=Dioszegia hungarica TaxID=4972 RepID=A0AA38H4W5_9TREE|nr:aldehyde dehydrogenase domain-containing protein [Dioszegia hungarica]KAI9633985.1 aldehyde dehydrogenase domain-containing protein [Dioszegia hungarica]
MSEIAIGQDRKSVLGLVDGAAQTAISIKGSIPPTIDGSEVSTTREPFGPVLSIPAFNFPMTLAMRSIVDPLACGNTVIFKTSRYIPQIHALLHPLFADAGLPAGALQILHYSDEHVAERVEQMIAHPDVRMVNFTGSTNLGRILAAQCGKHLKPSIMELGGKSAAIVLESADLKVAANNILFGALFNSGQVCMSTERVLVQESIMPALEAELLSQWGEVKDKSFDVVRADSIREVEGLVQEAIDQGAKRITPSPSTAHAATPSIISNPPPVSSIWSTETFSPTLTLTSYSSQTDLLEKLNSVHTGLSASIFGDTASAVALAKHVDCGAVHVNGMTVHDEATLPFGGVRESGWGRFNGQGAIEGFTWVKNVRVVKDPHGLPLGAL